MYDLAISEDGAIVSGRADYCLSQRDAWLAIARQLATRGNMGRGYRVAVSRAGTWARRATKAYRDEVTRSQRIALYTSEVLDTRADVASFNAWIPEETGFVLVADHAMAAK